jgi:hypothetical protein
VAVLSGTSAFVGGVSLANDGMVKPEGRNEMMRAIKNYLPLARQNAEGIIDSGPASPSPSKAVG